MQDKELMENELLLIKGACDLYQHGALESPTAEVHEAFQNALATSINIQNKIYNLMAQKGWYQTDVAEPAKVTSTKQKFSNN